MKRTRRPASILTLLLFLAGAPLAAALAPAASPKEDGLLATPERVEAGLAEVVEKSPKLVSPFFTSPDTAPETQSTIAGNRAGSPSPIHGPFATLLQELAQDRQLPAPRIAAAVADYFEALGFATPGASASVFEENVTISYTQVVGDINGDGVDDVALDTYCVQYDPCMVVRGSLLSNPRGYLNSFKCAWPHQLVVVSGADGSELWNKTLDESHPMSYLVGCHLEFVVGTIHDNTTGLNHLLMYRWEIVPIDYIFEFVRQIRNTVYLANATNGKPIWSHTIDGYFATPQFANVFTAKNFLVNPILQTPPRQGLNVLPVGTQTGLFLQGVGFNYSVANSVVALPFSTGPFTLLYSYQPDEWAMGVDPLTGKTRWQRDTFQPSGRIPLSPAQPLQNPGAPRMPVSNRSQFPLALQSPPLPHTSCVYDDSIACNELQFNPMTAPRREAMWYWGHQPCCFDVTGDGVPDLPFTIIDWSTTPATNYEGPYAFAGRIAFFDGASGKLLYSHYVEEGTGPGYSLSLQSLGDADGDGASDYLVHQVYYEWDYLWRLSVHRGTDGTELWARESRKALHVLPLGDADGSDGVDFVLLEWTYDVSKFFTFGVPGDMYARANVTWTPVQLLRGVDGSPLWEFRTFQALSDILYVFRSYSTNGLPDFDGDGVGDLLTDDPLFLPDLTVVHRITALSGRDLAPLFRVVATGTFAFPAVVGDVDGDATEDFLLVNGDINDLWGTTYTGHNGTALWSRRLMTARTSSYFQALPLLRTHAIQDRIRGGQDYLVNFQLQVTQVTQYFNSIFATTTTRPQVVRYGGLDGSVPWAIPAIWDLNLTVVVEGRSPASQTFVGALDYSAQLDAPTTEPTFTLPVQSLVGAATFLACLGASFLVGTRRWKP